MCDSCRKSDEFQSFSAARAQSQYDSRDVSMFGRWLAVNQIAHLVDNSARLAGDRRASAYVASDDSEFIVPRFRELDKRSISHVTPRTVASSTPTFLLLLSLYWSVIYEALIFFYSVNSWEKTASLKGQHFSLMTQAVGFLVSLYA